MKKIFMIIPAIVFLAGCSKGGFKPSALTSFNITNSVVGGSTLTLNNVGANIPNNGFTQCTLFAGQTQIKLGDTSMHPQQVYYNQTVATTSSSYYSLFQTGTSPSQVDNVLIKENYQNYTTNIAGLRFINLSPGSNSVSVDIQGEAKGSEVNSLTYKAYSGFKQYNESTAGISYTFEFRDASSGTLIASYNFTPLIYHNTTLALAGLESNPTVIQVNEY